MNTRLITLFLFLILLSCSKRDEVVYIYSPEDFYSKIKIIDTTCKNEELRAEKDIKAGKLSLNKEHVHIWKDYFEYDKLNVELEKFNIIIDTTSPKRKTNSYSMFSRSCYEQTMKDYIQKKYGYSLIDSLAKEVDKKYILDHPDKVFKLSDCDNYYSYDSLEEFELSCYYDFIYPAQYQYGNKNKKSLTVIDFVLLKDGTLKDINTKSYFHKEANKKFKVHFEEQIGELLKKINWETITNREIPVNSKITYKFIHK